MISTVIPVYNTKSEWLEQAVQSILSQTYKKFEILLVNDCSTNQPTIDSLKKLEEYPEVRVIHLEENAGIGGAINKGIDEAKYGIIARMDSDDIAHNERFQAQIDYLIDNPNVDLVGAQINYLTLQNEQWTLLQPAATQHPQIITKEVAQQSHWFLNHPTVMFRKSSVLRVGGYDESLRGLAEDYELWIRMIKNKMVMHNLPGSLLALRINPDSLVQNFKQENADFLNKTQQSL